MRKLFFACLFVAASCLLIMWTSAPDVYTVHWHESSVTDTLSTEADVDYIINSDTDEPYTIYLNGDIIHEHNN